MRGLTLSARAVFKWGSTGCQITKLDRLFEPKIFLTFSNLIWLEQPHFCFVNFVRLSLWFDKDLHRLRPCNAINGDPFFPPLFPVISIVPLLSQSHQSPFTMSSFTSCTQPISLLPPSLLFITPYLSFDCKTLGIQSLCIPLYLELLKESLIILEIQSLSLS